MSFVPDQQRRLDARIELVPLVGVLSAIVVLLLAVVPKEQRVTNDASWLDGARPPFEYHAITVQANGLLYVDGQEMSLPGLASLPWRPQVNARHVVVTLSGERTAAWQDFIDARDGLAGIGFADEDVLLVSNGGPGDD